MEDRLFLVFRPTGRALVEAQEWQQRLAQRYQLYSGPLPPLHVTVSSFVPSPAHPLVEMVGAINTVCRAHSSFTVRIEGFSFFPEPHLSVNLRVVDQPEIRGLAADVRSALVSYGIDVPLPEPGWQPHMSLVNNIFADRPWSQQEFGDAQAKIAQQTVTGEWEVNRLELWRPSFDPHVAVVAAFPLGQLTSSL